MRCAEWIVITLLAAGFVYLIVDKHEDDKYERLTDDQMRELRSHPGED